MKLFLLLLFLAAISSCSNHPKENNSAPAVTIKDITTWLYYDRDSIDWAADFTALDTASASITKAAFLEQLTTGKFIPLKATSPDTSLCYQLHRISESSDKSLGDIIKNKAIAEHHYYRMEGQPLPDFDFVDLKGTAYNRNTMKGKLLVLKCWFISCVPCVAEMPELNKLVEKYSGNKNVVFLSFAFDQPKELEGFLKKTTFDYNVVANKEDYMMNVLNVDSYPTHLLVDENGLIVKMSNEYQDIFRCLDKKNVEEGVPFF